LQLFVLMLVPVTSFITYASRVTLCLSVALVAHAAKLFIVRAC